MDVQITNIDRLSGNDLGAQFTMRYRLESDPDVDASYTPVTDTRTTLGVTYPYFDVAVMPDGIYIVHTYLTADGTATGTKLRVEITDSGLT